MNEQYEKVITISSSQVDLYNHLRPSALLQEFQDVSTEHATLQNMGREYLVEHCHACWILARVWFRLRRPLSLGEQVTLRTWHRGGKGLILYRDLDVLVQGELVGEATAAWVVADLDDRKMLRPGSVDTIRDAQSPQQVKEKQLKLIRCPSDRRGLFERTIRYSDLDVNGHMNNTKYADVILDALAPQELSGRFISELQLNYSGECKAGETMEIGRSDQPGFCYIDGVDRDGKRRFEATIQFQTEL